MWIFGRKCSSGVSTSSTAEQVTQGVDGSGLTAIVTGASSGLGAETTRVLVMRGVHVVMAVRNVDAGKKVKENIFKENPNAKIDVMKLDLSSMASVRSFASEYISLGLPLNILINNAGILGTPFTLTEDNIELQFATNYLGHFLLTNLLLDTMKNTVKGSKREGRIVNISSVAHFYPFRGGINFEKINDESSYDRYHAYVLSKLANILHANQLAKDLKHEGYEITANSVHPGVIFTRISRDQGTLWDGLFRILGKFILKNIGQGASTMCYVALNPQVNGVTGKYFVNNKIAKPSAEARNPELAKQLWDFSMKLTHHSPVDGPNNYHSTPAPSIIYV